MSFLKKAMSSIGVGSAKVDTVLDSDTIQAGMPVTGTIYIKGGNVEQKIDNIFLTVNTEYITTVESDDYEEEVREIATIQKEKITIDQVIEAKQEGHVPFEFILSPHTPVSIGKTKVWVNTSLDIKMAIDPTDDDPIKVEPHPYMDTVLSALENLGFRLREAENEYYRPGKVVPFVQEFEFVAQGAFRGQLDELEVVFFVYDDCIELALEIDRRARGFTGFFAEMLDSDEVNARIAFNDSELEEGPEYIAEQLERYIEEYV